MVLPPGTSLTSDAILAVTSGNLDLKPVVQILDIRQIGSCQAVQERFRMVVSDGKYAQQAILASQLNQYVKSGQVKEGSLVRLQEYICNTVQGRKIIIVLNMDIVLVEAEIIGDPKQMTSTGPSVAIAGASGAQDQQQKRQPQESMNGSCESNEVQSRTYQAQRPLNTGPNIGGSFAGSERRPGGVTQSQQSVITEGSYPSPIYSNKGPIAKNEAPARILPIAALNPYQGRWTIKARVTAKGELRRFHNARGDGKVFHFDLLDADGGEIRATCFNTVADQFYDRIEVGKVYLISKGSLKASQRSFNHLKHEWEIFLENSSKVEPCFEEDVSIPQQQFDFKSISEIENVETNAMVDVIGIVMAVSPTNTIMRKNGVETQKRTVQLRDKSGKSVELTMWGAFCGRVGQELQYLCDSGHYPVLAIKAGRISDFCGKSVGTISTTQLLINPEIAAAHSLTGWFQKEGKTTNSQSISKEGSTAQTEMRKTIAQIKDEGLGMSDKPDWIAVKATIASMKADNFCYTACPMALGDRQCNKKVTNNGDGTWRCDRCDRSFPECDYRYLLSIQVQDHSGITWITAFQEAGQEIMGVSAKELYLWKQDDDPQFEDTIQRLLFTQHLFKLKVKEENFNDERRVKCTLIRSEKLDHSAESKILIELIGKISNRDSMSDPVLASRTMEGSNIMFDGGFSGYGVSVHGRINSTLADSGVIEPAYGYNSGNSFSSTGNGGFGGGSMHSTNSCFKCGQGNHWARDCPNQSRRGYGGGGGTSSGGYHGKRSGGYGGGY